MDDSIQAPIDPPDEGVSADEMYREMFLTDATALALLRKTFGFAETELDIPFSTFPETAWPAFLGALVPQMLTYLSALSIENLSRTLYMAGLAPDVAGWRAGFEA